MSLKLMLEALQSPLLPPDERLLVVMLAEHADANGSGPMDHWRWVMDEYGWSFESLGDVLLRLNRRGTLTWDEVANVYWLHLDKVGL